MASVGADTSIAAEASRTVAADWAGAFLNTRGHHLPPDVTEIASRAVLDFIGVALAGSQLPVGRIVEGYFTGLGGRPEATVLSSRARLPGIHAAIVNGVHGHTLDMDDGHRLAAGHPGAAVMAAALAAAEMHQRSGAELLRAVTVGYEVFVRLGRIMNPTHLRRGFHTTATVGPIAAAAAAAMLHPAIDEQRFVRAIGLSGVQGAGLLEVLRDGAMAKPFQTGRASAAGLLAVELASRGMEGPRSIIEGEDGFLAAMCGPVDTSALVDGIGADWAITGIYFKAHASCRHTHAAIDVIQQLRREGLVPEQVASVAVHTYSVAWEMCGSSVLPTGPVEAKFSIPFTVALALSKGHAAQSAFTEQAVKDEAIRALAQRVSVVVAPDLDAGYPRRRGVRVHVALRDGTDRTVEIPLPRGEPELPLDLTDLSLKFHENVRGVIDQDLAARIERAVLALESVQDITEVWRGA